MLSNPKKFTLTLIFYFVLTLTFVAVTGSNVNRRDHLELTRLIKKRAPPAPNLVGGLVNVAPDPSASKPIPSSASTDPTPTPTTTPQESSPAASLVPPSIPLIPSIVNITSISSTATSSSISPSLVPSPSANVSSSASLTTTSVSSSTTPPAQTSRTPNVVGVSQSPVASTSDNTQTITQTATGQAQSSTAPATPASATTTTKKTTLTVLIVIAASIAGVAIIWTIIRKWKFRPSSQFEDRMQPIDWQPTSNHDDGISSAHRRLSNASSFHSGSGHIDNNGVHGVAYGASLDRSNSLNPLPDHDFTAGASTLAPVGGYADLSRDPNPQPQMQQTLARGPSANRPNFGIPIHHQAGYGAQDPYGGMY